MIIKIEEHNTNQVVTTIDNVTNLKQMRISNKNKFKKEELNEPNIEMYKVYNDRENETFSDTKMLTALVLERNNRTLEPECHLIYDNDGDVHRCTVWLMNDNGFTIERLI